MAFDLVIKNGTFFDGSGAPGVPRHVGIAQGRVAALSEAPLDETGAEVIDARAAWVMPGFLDLHTHYDAELLAAPALSESLRHGVTTVTVGSCSISAILSEPEDCSDLFTRVEAVPREAVLPLLRAKKTWSTPQEYIDFLGSHPLGANVTAFLGHSDLRVRVLGLERAVDTKTRPSERELSEMERWLEAALDAGLLGLSGMTNPWDKLDGDRQRSARLPSTYAHLREFRRLNRVLRRRGAILQSAPNLVTKVNMFLFLFESMGLFRRPLRTTLITLADPKANPGLDRLVGWSAGIANRVLDANLRWQMLPVPFEVYSDGMELVVFEEFPAGEEALHIADVAERKRLLMDPAYRRRFRRDYEKRFTPRVWHRDFDDTRIVACPDESVVGLSVGAVAKRRGVHPVDAFLDLVVEHGKALRWRMTLANHRDKELAWMMRQSAALIGFSDAGAHLRNMAFYSFPLRMLRFVRDHQVMAIEQAVYRLTGEIADWLGVDAGRLALGGRADVVVVDPAGLDSSLDEYHEAAIDELGLVRMVNRSERAVRAVLVNGRAAFRDGVAHAALGRERGFGRFLSARRLAPV